MVLKVSLNTGINRIRLEFKVFCPRRHPGRVAAVLIESDWNLKDTDIYLLANVECVLIESDWNLKKLWQEKEW